MEQRTHEEEWTEEEHLPVDPAAAEPEQGVNRLLTPQTESEQPNEEQVTHPQTRRSTRDRKPTQMFTYPTLGQPSYPMDCQQYQPGECNHIP